MTSSEQIIDFNEVGDLNLTSTTPVIQLQGEEELALQYIDFTVQ